MKIHNNPYNNFKPYNYYRGNKLKPEKNEKLVINSLIGSAIGASAAFFATKQIKKENSLVELFKVFSMVASANIGGVIGGSVGAKKENKRK